MAPNEHDPDSTADLRPWPPQERGAALDVVVELHAHPFPLTRAVLAAHVSPGVVMTPPPVLVDVFQPYIGVDGVLAWFDECERRWPDVRFLPDRYATAGDSVVVLGRLALGDERVESAWLWSIRDGRVSAVRAFRYASEALVRLDAVDPGGASA